CVLKSFWALFWLPLFLKFRSSLNNAPYLEAFPATLCPEILLGIVLASAVFKVPLQPKQCPISRSISGHFVS
ncbi:MAG: hypothetical protein K2P03_06475, partial [Lachnospiraceae bacterium]|nr:hypothetical protein [Lachnospiraceae bacterium]